MLASTCFSGMKTKFPEGQYSVSQIGTTSNTVGIGKGVRAKTFGLFRFQRFHLGIDSFSGWHSPDWSCVAPNMTLEITHEKF
jgi:hypothetical protein